MKFIPVLFSALMVNAIQANRKTKTRRVVHPQPSTIVPAAGHPNVALALPAEFVVDEKSTIVCPYGNPGDVLYVRENHYQFGKWVSNGKTKTGKPARKFVAETGTDTFRYFDYPPSYVEPSLSIGLGWYLRPSLFMPKNRSRFFLEVVSVKVERAQDISEADAIAEGVETIRVCNLSDESDKIRYRDYHFADKDNPQAKLYKYARQSFISLWKKINGFESWRANPFVWVIEFKKIARPATF